MKIVQILIQSTACR